MASVQDIFDEINRIENAKNGISEAIEEKGVEVPENAKIQELPPLIRSIPTAVTEIFWAEYGVTTLADVDAAITAGKICYLIRNTYVLRHIKTESNFYIFAATYSGRTTNAKLNRTTGAWTAPADYLSEDSANKTTEVNANSDNTHYPSAKAVYDAMVAGKEIFWATYGTTTAAQIDAAVAAGKVVVAKRDSSTAQPTYAGGNATYIFFGEVYADSIIYWRLQRSNDTWSSGTISVESLAHKVNTLTGNETNESKYPSTKALADALGKMGVISQTQTWTGSAATGYDYTMSNLVRGIIPQSFIDSAVSAGAVFNATSGYFELNGLTDISYDEMLVIMRNAKALNICNRACFGETKLRTVFNFSKDGYNAINNNFSYAFRNAGIERIFTNSSSTISGSVDFKDVTQVFYNCQYLKYAGYIRAVNAGAGFDSQYVFYSCHSLEEIYVRELKGNFRAIYSPLISLASVVYMVDNAANTSAITITLHATAYARCQTDTTEYTHSGQTYTGIIAYAAAKNITIQSA